MSVGDKAVDIYRRLQQIQQASVEQMDRQQLVAEALSLCGPDHEARVSREIAKLSDSKLRSEVARQRANLRVAARAVSP